jgi:predicted MFS family arabinose efflux permease
MNTGGSLGGVVGIPVVAYLSGRGDWNTAFFIGAGFAVLTAVIWAFIDASHVAAAPDSTDGHVHPEARAV